MFYDLLTKDESIVVIPGKRKTRGRGACRNAAQIHPSCHTKLGLTSCVLSADLVAGRRTMNVEPTPSTLSAVTSP